MKKMFHSLEEAVRSLAGDQVRILGRQPVYGGDINDAYCLNLSDGSRLFMKANSIGNADFFRAEAEGLAAIRQTGAIRTPEIYGFGEDRKEHCSFLLMEYVRPSGKEKDYWERFGRQLAAMHLADQKKMYGFPEDNYIGASPQINRYSHSWISFFRECRLEPQIRMADRYLDGGQRQKLIRLLDRLDHFLPEPDRASLLHGDLWGGNVICGGDGRAWLIDPAVYLGHSEADMAMTRLFGGFPETFYRAYGEVIPWEEGFRDRQEIYNLYHLLNHLNLFGPAYLGSVMRIASRFSG